MNTQFQSFDDWMQESISKMMQSYAGAELEENTKSLTSCFFS